MSTSSVLGGKLWASTRAEVPVDGKQLAHLFWALPSDEQAAFFHELGRVSEGSLAMQMLYAATCEEATIPGRHAMQTIGEQAE